MMIISALTLCMLNLAFDYIEYIESDNYDLPKGEIEALFVINEIARDNIL